MRKTSASSAENPVRYGKATACCSCPRSQVVPKAASFLIEINVEELADLPAVVADVAREAWKSLGQRIERFRNGRSTTVHSWGAVREAPKRGGDFNRNWHKS